MISERKTQGDAHMKIADLIRPEDSRIETESGIDTRIKPEARDFMKTAFWIVIAVSFICNIF